MVGLEIKVQMAEMDIQGPMAILDYLEKEDQKDHKESKDRQAGKEILDSGEVMGLKDQRVLEGRMVNYWEKMRFQDRQDKKDTQVFLGSKGKKVSREM